MRPTGGSAGCLPYSTPSIDALSVVGSSSKSRSIVCCYLLPLSLAVFEGFSLCFRDEKKYRTPARALVRGRRTIMTFYIYFSECVEQFKRN